MLTIGESIAIWRVEKGYSQAHLAQKSNVLQPNLSRIEKDKVDITLDTLTRIARAMFITPGQLIDGPLPFSETGLEQLSRSDLERIAHAITNRVIQDLPNHLKSLAEVFDVLTCRDSKRRHGSKKIIWAWIKAKSLLSKKYINALLAKIDEAQQVA
ncbi:MAG: transcriptional regulator with XRE-family HTH domain [Candidatus Omnitrophota bacterium]|jgi:transcriptional regulator with XRE-family HTH domain